MFKKYITNLLETQAKRLLKKNDPKIVAVTGSVGKTSTKIAIATILSEKYRVLAHYGSYNTHIALPMAMFNQQMPDKLSNPFAWLKIFIKNELILSKKYPYDVFVLELGTDHPGEIAYFKKYVKPDIAIVTAVAPEHMEFFGTMEAVAQEELAVAEFSKLTLVNRDDIDAKFVKYVPEGANLDTYGTSGVAEYHFLMDDAKPGKGFKGKLVSPEFGQQPVQLNVVGEHNVRTVVGAAAVGIKMGLSAEQILAGVEKIRPVHGRMNTLRGLNNSTIIDDTYNSSPLAAVAALQTLYLFPAKQRIAILGSMNELGEYSKQAHEEVGKACDSSLIDWLITVGDEANKYLAPAAASKGCRIQSFDSPYDAGAFAHKIMEKDGAVILAKGSQNGIYLEEAVKMLLHSTEEEKQIVRQTSDWLAKKQAQFSKFTEPTAAKPQKSKS